MQSIIKENCTGVKKEYRLRRPIKRLVKPPGQESVMVNVHAVVVAIIHLRSVGQARPEGCRWEKIHQIQVRKVSMRRSRMTTAAPHLHKWTADRIVAQLRQKDFQHSGIGGTEHSVRKDDDTLILKNQQLPIDETKNLLPALLFSGNNSNASIPYRSMLMKLISALTILIIGELCTLQDFSFVDSNNPPTMRSASANCASRCSSTKFVHKDNWTSLK